VAFLLDTSALSEPMRRQPREVFMERLRRIPSEELFTSSICVMELRYGCALKGDADLWRRIEENVLSNIPVVSFGLEEAACCGELLAGLSKQGTPIGVEDSQIGATALMHQLTLVTFNLKHFTKIPNLQVEDWLS
jgi:tRNA(fMet)-specific endonuclease VapC